MFTIESGLSNADWGLADGVRPYLAGILPVGLFGVEGIWATIFFDVDWAKVFFTGDAAE